LFDLIRFGEGAARLQVQDLFDIGVGEDVVTAFDSLGEAEGGQRTSQIVEADVGVGRSLNYSLQDGLTHVFDLPRKILGNDALM
jgi:hypothetical protein